MTPGHVAARALLACQRCDASHVIERRDGEGWPFRFDCPSCGKPYVLRQRKGALEMKPKA